MRRTLPFYFLLLFSFSSLLSGCGASTVNQLQKKSTAQQLAASEILTVIKNNTLFLRGHKIESYFYFDESGKTFARDIFNNTDVGNWDVSSEDELCFKMDNWWLKNLKCFPVFKDADKYYLFNNSGVLEFSADFFEGDSQNLYRDLPKSKTEKKFLRTQKKEVNPPEPQEPIEAEEPIETGDLFSTEEPSKDELKATVKWMAKDCPDCNLENANLAGADLIGAQLEGANLSGANLSRANLRRANLKDADLEDANLSYANLPGADLQDSDLENADFTGANLIRANLTGADIDGAIFTDALLEGVEGLQR